MEQGRPEARVGAHRQATARPAPGGLATPSHQRRLRASGLARATTRAVSALDSAARHRSKCHQAPGHGTDRRRTG